jgi:hypothetical protein
MKTTIKRWLTPPVFLGDEEKTRRASLLNMIINGTALYLLLSALSNMFGGEIPTSVTFVNIIGVFITLLLRHWLQRGNLIRAEVGLAIFGFLWITLISARLGTIRTPTTAIYLFMVILAGLLFVG